MGKTELKPELVNLIEFMQRDEFVKVLYVKTKGKGSEWEEMPEGFKKEMEQSIKESEDGDIRDTEK